MQENEIAIYLADGGMNSASPEARVPQTQYVRGVNVAIVNEFPTTRYGVRVVPIAGDNLESFQRENVQGAMFFNPANGQGAVSFGRDAGMLVAAVGGRKYSITPEGRGLSTTGVLRDITNRLVSDSNLHLVCWAQWENYAMAQDGNGNCFIWDGDGAAFASTGYNITDKESSQVPNGGMAMAYAHGRGVVAVNNRAVLSSDGLNEFNLSSSVDVLSFRQQVYWATGQYFAPPSSLGSINALAILPQRNTQHGHGALMCHCDDGIFSIELNVYPRSKWSETPMVKVAYTGAGACGPYAVALLDGDQIFRSQVGVQTLRSAAAESSLVGNPQVPISEPIRSWFTQDAARWLRFATVGVWQASRRVFISCYPIVQGRFRWHRGLVCGNFHPVDGKQTPMVWEGLWTLPMQARGVVQQLNGKLDGEERHFAFCRGADGLNRLVEFRRELTADRLQDGTEQRIRCQLITRRVDAQKPFLKKNFQTGILFLSNVVGKVDWGVWYRTAGTSKWVLWRSGVIDATSTQCGDNLEPEQERGQMPIPLGSLPNKAGQDTSRHVQFLIRWAGYCSIEGVRVTHGGGDPDENKFSEKALNVRFCERALVDYNDYEYSDATEAESWLKNL